MGRRSFPRFGERLVALREARGWSTTYAARQAGLGRVTLERYELGTRFPLSDTSLASLCRLYGVSSDFLLGLVDERLPWRGG